MYFRLGMRQQEIAEQLQVSQPTVARDVKILVSRWREAALGDVESLRGKEVADLFEMERDCALQFQNTKDPRFMTERRLIKKLRSELLGLNAPVRLAGPTGGPSRSKPSPSNYPHFLTLNWRPSPTSRSVNMDTKKLVLNVTLEAIREELARRGPGIERQPIDLQVAHCIAWIETNCFILDPAATGGVLLFTLYDYQKDLVRTFFEEANKARNLATAGIRIEKSRQMGDTWLLMALELYTLKHWKSFQALNVSLKEDKVDDGGQNSTTDSLYTAASVSCMNACRPRRRSAGHPPPAVGQPGARRSDRRGDSQRKRRAGRDLPATASGTRLRPPSKARPSRPPSPRRYGLLSTSPPPAATGTSSRGSGAPIP